MLIKTVGPECRLSYRLLDWQICLELPTLAYHAANSHFRPIVSEMEQIHLEISVVLGLRAAYYVRSHCYPHSYRFPHCVRCLPSLTFRK
jgi:hypothetical protein